MVKKLTKKDNKKKKPMAKKAVSAVKKTVKKVSRPVVKKVVKKPTKKVVAKSLVKKVVKKTPKKTKTSVVKKPKISKDQLADRANNLVVRGRQRGFVTFSEILKEFPNVETDIDFLEELYARFEEAHIDVIEEGGLLDDEPEILEKVKGAKILENFLMVIMELEKF